MLSSPIPDGGGTDLEGCRNDLAKLEGKTAFLFAESSYTMCTQRRRYSLG